MDAGQTIETIGTEGPCAPDPGWRHDLIPVTSKRDYITGMTMLNLVDPGGSSSGDWHCSGLQSPKTGVPEHAHYVAMSLSGKRAVNAPVDILGARRVCDVRGSLRRIRHPAGWRKRPVWGCYHERAIADLCWRSIQVLKSPRAFEESMHPVTIAKWLWTMEQFDNLIALLDLLTPHLDDDRRDRWLAWQAELAIDAEW